MQIILIKDHFNFILYVVHMALALSALYIGKTVLNIFFQPINIFILFFMIYVKKCTKIAQTPVLLHKYIKNDW